ncbi:MAG: hypothetical protein ACPHRO_08340 [Nannocystaceae bacterium]
MRSSPLHARVQVACLALCAALSACSDREFEGRLTQAKDDQRRLYDGQYPYRPPTEVEKIERLIEFVRKSDGVYLRREREMTPGLAAAWMERRYFTRWGRQIRTAARFVGIVSERPLASSRPFIFRPASGEEVLVRTLLFEELRRLEAPPGRVVDAIMDPKYAPPAPERQSGKPPTHPIEKTIELIEHAPPSLRFVVTERDETRRVERGGAFAKELRKKTRWLASDITDVEEWIDEVATRDFMSYQLFVVETEDGSSRVPLHEWLRDPARSLGIRQEGAP